MVADAVLEIRLKTHAENGRVSAISGDVYHCPLLVDGEAFDCRVYHDGKVLELGHTYQVDVRFLSPHDALPHLSIGKQISLWEGKEIATGTVLQVRPPA